MECKFCEDEGVIVEVEHDIETTRVCECRKEHEASQQVDMLRGK